MPSIIDVWAFRYQHTFGVRALTVRAADFMIHQVNIEEIDLANKTVFVPREEFYELHDAFCKRGLIVIVDDTEGNN
jgi:hypothetical protein